MLQNASSAVKLNHSTTVPAAPARRPRGSVAKAIPAAWDDSMLACELAAAANGVSARSIANRRSTIRWMACYFRDEHGITDPADVTKNLMLQAMSAIHKTRARSGARTAFNDCKAFWDVYCAEYGTPSPLTGIKRPADTVTPVAILTTVQVESVLKVTAGRAWRPVRNSAIIHLLLETGMRRAELCALDVADVDVRARDALIRRGKGGRSRSVAFGPATALALNRWLRMHPLKDEGGNVPLFTTTFGKRVAECSVGDMLHKVGEEAGVRNLRAHQLRHTWTHVGLAAGMQEHDLMQLGGWTSPQQLGRYGAALAAQRAMAAAKSKPVLSLIRS